jgi:predicted transposase/invertase (TIGR01784 family)
LLESEIIFIFAANIDDTMGKFINPFTDVGFKRIFGQEMSKPVLIAFLNSLLEGERKIIDLQYLDKEKIGISDGDRSLIYDVLCKTDSNEYIIVEMQNKSQPFFKNRSIYYVSRSIIEQGERGAGWSYDIKAVYLVAFLNFHIKGLEEKFRTDVGLMDMQQLTLFSDKERMIFLQLPYFTKELEDCDTIFERFIYILKHMDILQRMPFLAQDAVFKRLSEIAEVASLSKEERQAYDENLKHYRDTIAVMQGQYLEGEEKGRAEGRKDVARQLKLMGLSVEDIAKATSLSVEEIENL